VKGGGPIAAYICLVGFSVWCYCKLRGDQLLPERQTRPLETRSVPDVSGTWNGTWSWTDSEGGTETLTTERVSVTEQNGRSISGTITDQEGLHADFRGEIYNRVVTMYYVSTKEQRLSCGSLTVELSGDGRSMDGTQVFYAIDLKRLVTTPYRLER